MTVGGVEIFQRLLPLPTNEPAYLALAHAIRVLVMDGRLALGSRLPSERTLALALGLSRTTITATYRELVETGWASARQGSGTTVRMPVRDRAPSIPLVPGVTTGAIDLSAAAGLAPVGTDDVVRRALEWLPRSLGGAGYEPLGATHLRERIAAWFDARGVPTDPDQVIVTPGALAALSVVLHAAVKPGARVAVDSPTYPGALGVADVVHARQVSVPLQEDGWDVDAWVETLRRAQPAAAYLIPDFHNPSGALMESDVRERLAAQLRRAGTIPVIDETLVSLDLEGGAMPTPWAALDDRAITVGSLSKVLWGGFRIGWIRCPSAMVEALRHQHLQLSLGASALDQLVATTYLDDPSRILTSVLARMRSAREAWLDELDWELPDWRATSPRGGLSLWVDLPRPKSAELALAGAAHGLVLVPGTRFSGDRTGARRLRLPLTLPPEVIPETVRRLAAAWDDALAGTRSGTDAGDILAL